MEPGYRWTRRSALKALFAAGTAAAAGVAPAADTRARLMRRIPASGEEIPGVGLGTYSTFDVGTGAAEREPLRAVLKLFVEHGGHVVDSSPMYGAAEGVLGDLAAEVDVRPKLFYATKVWTRGEAAGVRQMEQSFKRMRTQVMDLMQVHNLLDWQTHLTTLRAWKAQGRVRYIGVTHYTSSAYDELERVLKQERWDFVQLNYSVAERDAERRLLPLAAERGVAVLVNRPFAQANLFTKVRGKDVPGWAAEFDCTSWAQFFLKYILAHPAVTCAIPATRNPKHLTDNMQAGIGRLPNAAQRERMAAYVSTL